MLPGNRPVYLNLFRIHLPMMGWVSILHRLSGAMLFLLLPLMVWGLSLTLSGETGFAQVLAWFSEPFIKLLVVGLIWAFAHHYFAGLRHLALDIHWGVKLDSARCSSILVLLAGGSVAVFALWSLFR